MKEIRTIKYIDLFVKTHDHNLDYLIDLTTQPYYTKVSNLYENTYNICKIIYDKSLKYNFSKFKAIEFAKIAAIDHLNQDNIEDQDIQKNIINKAVEKILSNHYPESFNFNCYHNTESDFIIAKNDKNQIVIHDYGNAGIEILKYLVGLETKMIKYSVDIPNKSIQIGCLSEYNNYFKITDLDISNDNINYIKQNLNKETLIEVSEVNQAIQVYFLGKLIFDTTEGKISKDEITDDSESVFISETFTNIISDNEKTEESYYEKTEENCFTSENNESTDFEQMSSQKTYNNLINQDSHINVTKSKKKILLNPYIFMRHR